MYREDGRGIWMGALLVQAAPVEAEKLECDAKKK